MIGSRTWGHAIEPLGGYQPPPTLPDPLPAGAVPPFWGGPLTCGARRKKDEPNGGHALWRSLLCCGFAAIYTARYCYVTGRGGRVTDRRLDLCERHGRAFADAHQLMLPPPAVTQDDANGRTDQYVAYEQARRDAKATA